MKAACCMTMSKQWLGLILWWGWGHPATRGTINKLGG